MSSKDIPFEDRTQAELRRMRRGRTGDSPPELGGYIAVEGETQELTGDDVGPYVHAIGRASSDGVEGSVPVEDGEAQRLLTDEHGRLWVRRVGGGGGGDDPTEITGTVSIDGPVELVQPVTVVPGDTFPVEGTVSIDGPVAVAGNVGITGPVEIDQPVTVTGSVGVSGPVTVQGDVGITGPVTVDGAVAIDGPVTIDQPVTVNGTVGVSGTVNTNASVQGNVAHDSPDAGNPVKVGGVATAGVQAEVDGGDRVQAAYDLRGRAQVLPHPQVTEAVELVPSGPAPGAMGAFAGPVDVRHWRRITLFFDFLANAADQKLTFFFGGTASAAPPAGYADIFGLSALEEGEVANHYKPTFIYNQGYEIPASGMYGDPDGRTRGMLSFDVTHLMWFALFYGADSQEPGTIQVHYSLSL